MAVVTEKFCPICGKDVKDDSFKRFGEYLCSEEHAEQYVKEVRAKQGTANAAIPEERPAPRRRRRGC